MKNRHRVSQVVSKLICSRATRRKIFKQGAADRRQCPPRCPRFTEARLCVF